MDGWKECYLRFQLFSRSPNVYKNGSLSMYFSLPPPLSLSLCLSLALHRMIRVRLLSIVLYPSTPPPPAPPPPPSRFQRSGICRGAHIWCVWGGAGAGGG